MAPSHGTSVELFVQLRCSLPALLSFHYRNTETIEYVILIKHTQHMLLSTRIATRSISRFRCSSSSIATRSISRFRCSSSSSMASFSTATTEPQVTVAHHNNSTILTLSRPKKLNSLTLQMIHELDQGFQQGLSNNTKVFLMDGAGPKSFCAGGDVAAVRAAGLGLEGDKSLTRDFFFHEYRLNKKIGDINETIPQVSVWDGITM